MNSLLEYTAVDDVIARIRSELEQYRVHIRRSQPTRPNALTAERLREQTIISVFVSNYLHDARIMDATDPAQQLRPLALDTLIDGDIRVRIEVQKDWSGPAWISWCLWPDEQRRRTSGTMSLNRLSVVKACLTIVSYDRSLARRARLARIPMPHAKWGVSSAAFAHLGLETTF